MIYSNIINATKNFISFIGISVLFSVLFWPFYNALFKKGVKKVEKLKLCLPYSIHIFANFKKLFSHYFFSFLKFKTLLISMYQTREWSVKNKSLTASERVVRTKGLIASCWRRFHNFSQLIVYFFLFAKQTLSLLLLSSSCEQIFLTCVTSRSDGKVHNAFK